jgi:hypothetical protein
MADEGLIEESDGGSIAEVSKRMKGELDDTVPL